MINSVTYLNEDSVSTQEVNICEAKLTTHFTAIIQVNLC